jgi:signal peptidase II
MNKYYKLLLIAGSIILIDQVTKALVLKELPLYHSVTVIQGFFDLTHIQNPGGAFGFLAGQSPFIRKIFFLCISSVVAVLIFFLYRNTPPTHGFLASAFALIFGGAIGNLIDRFRFGQVVDFLDFYAGQYHWPAFNVADSAITVGIVILGFHLLFKQMPN